MSDIAKIGEANDAAADSAFLRYVNSVDDVGDNIKSTANALKEHEKKVQQADAEAEAQKVTTKEVVSVADAYAMVEAEQAARSQLHKAQIQAAGSFVRSGINLTTNTATFMTNELDVSLAGGAEAMFNGETIAPLLAGGAVSLLPEGTMRDMVGNAVSGFMNLDSNNEIDEDTDQKYIEGEEDPASYNNALAEDMGQEEPPYDKNAVGEDTDEENEITADEYYTAETTDEATTISDAEIDEMADLDKWLDGAGGKENTLVDTLGKSIASLDVADPTEGIAESITKSVGKAAKSYVSKLFDERDATDNNQPTKSEDEIDLGV